MRISRHGIALIRSHPHIADGGSRGAGQFPEFCLHGTLLSLCHTNIVFIQNTVISKYTVFLKYIATAFLKIFPKYFPACSGKGNIDRGMIAI